MSPSLLPPAEEIALLRAEVASLRRELELTRGKAAEREEKGETRNGDDDVTRSGGNGGGGGGGNAQGIDSPSPSPPPSRSFWTADHPLGTSQVERYCRQMLLPWFGPEAQSRLASSSALVVGLGGLGCPAALYLAAAGVSRLGLCDRDDVDVSNLHRQVLHSTPPPPLSPGNGNAGETTGSPATPKVASAARALRRLNPATRLDLHPLGITRENALEVVGGYDVVLDCSDNAPTRYLLSDACCRRSSPRPRPPPSSRSSPSAPSPPSCSSPSSRSRDESSAAIPLVSGAAIGGDGQLTVYCAEGVKKRRRRRRRKGDGDDGDDDDAEDADDGSDDDDDDDGSDDDDDDDDTPCYRCLFPVPPPAASCGSCAEAGVLGPVPGVIGVLQALEAIKILALGRKREKKKKEERSVVGGGGGGEKPPPPPPPATPPAAMTPLARRMLAFDGRDARFRTVNLRPRNPNCLSCGCGGGRGREPLDISSYDYEAFTGRPSHDGPPPAARILEASRRAAAADVAARVAAASAADANDANANDDADDDNKKTPLQQKRSHRRRRRRADGSPFFLVDVRPSSQFALARLPGAVNVPWGGGGGAFLRRAAAALLSFQRQEEEEEEDEEEGEGEGEGEGDRSKRRPVFVVCRRGNDSQRAVAALDEAAAAAAAAAAEEAEAGEAAAAAPAPNEQGGRSDNGKELRSNGDQRQEDAIAKKFIRSFLEGRPALADVVGGLEGIAAAGFEFPKY